MLNCSNYFTTENEQKYLSNSQYKKMCGSLGMRGCEAKTIAEMRGEWKDAPSKAMLIGSYVDAWFEGTIEQFQNDHPEIYTNKGTLRAEYQKANEVIQRCVKDEYFMKFMSGKKQVVMEGEMFGALWKIKIDSYIEGKAIVDLKVVRNIYDALYVKDWGKIDFIRYWGYDQQLAIYQKVVEINTGKKLPVYIAAATKEEEPNIEIIHVDDQTLGDSLSLIENDIPRILALKAGDVEPDRCGKCNYCIHTKVLTAPIHYSQLTEGI